MLPMLLEFILTTCKWLQPYCQHGHHRYFHHQLHFYDNHHHQCKWFQPPCQLDDQRTILIFGFGNFCFSELH